MSPAHGKNKEELGGWERRPRASERTEAPGPAREGLVGGRVVGARATGGSMLPRKGRSPAWDDMLIVRPLTALSLGSI